MHKTCDIHFIDLCSVVTEMKQRFSEDTVLQQPATVKTCSVKYNCDRYIYTNKSSIFLHEKCLSFILNTLNPALNYFSFVLVKRGP